MSNLLEHLKEMKSQAELVDAWQKAFDVAIRLCTKKDTVIADLQSDNERLNEEYIKAHRLLIVRLGKIYELQEKYDKLKEIPRVLEMAENEANNQLYFSAYDRLRMYLAELTPEEMEMNDE